VEGGRFVLLLAALLGVVLFMDRLVRFPWYSFRPRDLDAVAADLEARENWKRRVALQTLADFHGHPFGHVACWPIQTHSPRQFDTMVALYQMWWQTARKAEGNLIWWHETGELGELYLRSSRENLLPLNAAPEVRELTEVPLPPLSPSRFVEGLRPRAEEAFRRVADIINKAPSGAVLARSERQVYAVFADLAWQALLLGLDLRTGAAEAARGRNGHVHGFRPAGERVASKVDQLLQRVADSVKEALLELHLGMSDEEQEEEASPTPLAPLAPEQFVNAIHGKVEDTLRRMAEAINASPSGRTDQATQQQVFDLVTQLGCEALELGLQLRVAAQESLVPTGQLAAGDWASKFRRMKAAEGRWPPPAYPGEGD
jgi:hypothetical protein